MEGSERWKKMGKTRKEGKTGRNEENKEENKDRKEEKDEGNKKEKQKRTSFKNVVNQEQEFLLFPINQFFPCVWPSPGLFAFCRLSAVWLAASLFLSPASTSASRKDFALETEERICCGICSTPRESARREKVSSRADGS